MWQAFPSLFHLPLTSKDFRRKPEFQTWNISAILTKFTLSRLNIFIPKNSLKFQIQCRKNHPRATFFLSFFLSSFCITQISSFSPQIIQCLSFANMWESGEWKILFSQYLFFSQTYVQHYHKSKVIKCEFE